MSYCTNCGKETSAKKTCEHCGVKFNKTHNFCKWCGTALETNAKICPNCQEPKKEGNAFLKVVGIILAVIFFIGAIAFVFDSILTFICFVLIGLLFLPFTSGIIRKLTHNKIKLRKIIIIIQIIVMVSLYVVGIVFSSGSASSNNQESLRTEINNTISVRASTEVMSKYQGTFIDSTCTTIKDNYNGTYDVYGYVRINDYYGVLNKGNFNAVVTVTEHNGEIIVSIDSFELEHPKQVK